MYRIIAHVKPKKKVKKILGAYAAIFIDYKDIDGAFQLAKFYLENDGWEVVELENEYYIVANKDEMGDGYEKYYEDVLDAGYSVIYNTYGR